MLKMPEAASELHVYSVSDGVSKPYYTSGSVSAVQFRPEKNSVSFLTSQSGDNGRALYEVPLDGGTAVKLFGLIAAF